MWNPFKRAPEQRPFTGAPRHARMKSYSAMSGYVYQYVFAGQRQAADRNGVEYAFSVTYDRKTNHTIYVLVTDEAIAPWCGENQRTLTNSERYGVAKMALRNAFDERIPAQIHLPIAPGAGEVRSILDELGC